jgi:hypothetical protein
VLVQWGITVAGLFIVLMLLGVAVVDVGLEYRRWRTIGDRLRAWSGRYPVLAAAFALLLGAMLGHFFWRTGLP